MIASESLVHESSVEVRFVGEDLDPDEMTRLLRIKPTIWHRKGESPWVRGKQRPRHHPPSFGSWSRHAKDRKPANLDEQVAELFARLPSSMEIWDVLAGRYSGHVDIVLWTRPGMQKVGLLPDTLSAIAMRKLAVEVSVIPITADAANYALRQLQRTMH